MNWKFILAVGTAGVSAALAQTPSMHPRPNIHDYRVQSKVTGATLAASVLSPAEVKSTFTLDLASKGYTVVEVAFYPDQGHLRISPEDFTLRMTGEKSTEMRPVSSTVVAHALGKKSPSQNPSIKPPVDVATTNTIGYESYPTYDQNGKQKQSGGWVVGSGVEVGAGPHGRSAPDRIPDNDLESLEAELANRSLQEDTISQPVAGYLYFRNSGSKKKDAAYELQYAPSSDSGPAAPVKLVIPKPEGK